MRAFESNRRFPFIAVILAGLAATFATPVVVAQDSSTVSGVAAPTTPFAAFERAPTTDAPTVQSSWRVVGSTLRPRVNDVSYTTNGSGGCVYVTAGSATTVWNTPLWIPDGANVQYLRIYVNDTSTSNVQGWFSIYDLYGGLVQEFAVASAGTPGETYFDSAQINHVIDYSLYSYVVNMRPGGTGSTLQFCGARIFYDN